MAEQATSWRGMDAKLPQIAVSTLVETIKAHLGKAKQAQEKSEQHYISAGLHLAELKDRYKQDVKPTRSQTWADFVREEFNLGQTRADELIRIATGRTTVAETRADTAKRVHKHAKAKKSALANADSGPVEAINNATDPANIEKLRGFVDDLQMELDLFADRFEPWSHYEDSDVSKLVRTLKNVSRLAQTVAQELEFRVDDTADEAPCATQSQTHH